MASRTDLGQIESDPDSEETVRPTPTIAFIMLCLSTLPGIGSGMGLLRAQAPETDTVAVVEAARAVLEGITTRDTELIRSVTAADLRLEGTSTGDDLPARAEGQSRDEFLAMILESEARFVERMWAPVVRIRGRTADVQAPYDFYRGGELSHCGVDLFQLVLTAEGWKVVALIWTVEQPPACELHPEGPPAEELGQKGRMMPDGLEYLERWAAGGSGGSAPTRCGTGGVASATDVAAPTYAGEASTTLTGESVGTTRSSSKPASSSRAS